MNKIISRIAVVAAAVTTFASCQMEIADLSTETLSVNLNLNADVEQTKTYLDENNTVLWGKNEAVTLYVGSGETAKFFDSASTDVYDGEASASFTFEIKDVAQAESYALGGIYPASAAMDDNNDPKKFKAILPQTQNAEEGKYDPVAYIMVLKPDTVEELPSEYQASFRRATALNKITLTNVREDITTVEIIVPEGKALAGRRYFDLTDGSSGEIYYGQSNTITVNSQYTGSTIDVWFCSWGVELAAGDELIVRMKNANKSFTRTIQANENGIKFVEGDLNTLKINMASATEESFENFAGEWLITGTTDGVTYAASSYESGNNLKATVTITVSDDVIPEVDGLENCKMLFTKVTEGEYEGMYTIQDANGKFLYAAASDKNQLKAGASASSAHYYWTVECNDGKYSVVASKSSNRNVMQFNPNNGSPLFNCYASASQTAIVLYPYSMVKVDKTPRISVNGSTTKDVVFGGETVTFDYELKYLDGKELTWAVSDEEMISAVIAGDGILSVTVAENDGDARSATITLSCGEATDVVLTINQAEYVDTSVIEKITVNEFLEKSVNVNVWYQLTGTIKEIKNTTYGNFYLEDETGYVYVYGLTAEKVASNDQSFNTLGLKVGDVVTLIGTRSQYANASVADQKEQVGGPAYYVSHQSISVAPSIICRDNVVTITAATGATIYYTTNGDVPTTESAVYIEAFEIDEDTVVKAIASEEGKLVSTVVVVDCIWVDPETGGDNTVVAPSGTILWSETWADAGGTSTTFAQNTAISSYNYEGRTGYEDNATSITYIADSSNNVRITKSNGANCTSGHLWFNKSVAGEFITSAIKLYGATSMTFSHSQGTSGSSCQTWYSTDGGSNWTSLGTQSGAIATKTYTFTVPEGTESIMIKLTHASSNAKNTRVDNLVLMVK